MGREDDTKRNNVVRPFFGQDSRRKQCNDFVEYLWIQKRRSESSRAASPRSVVSVKAACYLEQYEVQ